MTRFAGGGDNGSLNRRFVLPVSTSGRGGSRTLKVIVDHSAGFQPGPVANRVALPLFSSPTRIRIWNLSLEARHDVRFTIEPKAEGMGFEPT